MSSIAFDADYEEITLYKFSSGGIAAAEQINIVPQVIEVNMLESLFEPVIRAEMLIYDSIGLFVNFPLTGDEIVKISYTVRDTETRTEYMVIERVSDISVSDDNRNMVYAMQCVSIEAWQNARKNVQQAFNTTLGDAAERIFDQHIIKPLRESLPIVGRQVSLKNFFNFEKSGTQSRVWVIPNVRPFKAINMLAGRMEGNLKEHTHLFYQNSKGYWLRDLESMFDRNNTGFREAAFKNGYKYISDEVEQSTRMRNEERLVTAITYNKRISAMDQIAMGYFQNKLFEINPAQKAYNITETLLRDATFIENHPLSRTDYSQIAPIDYSAESGDGQPSEQSNFTRYNLSNDREFNTDHPVGAIRKEWGKSLISTVAMSQIDITVTIPADTKVNVGELFYMETPTTHGFNDNEEDPLISGYYLITEKRDTINQSGEMSTSLRLQKDSYKTGVDYAKKYVDEPGKDLFVNV